MRTVVISIFLSVSSVLIGQTPADTGQTGVTSLAPVSEISKHHNLSIDVLLGMILPAIRPRYEYMFNRFSGVGAEVSINLAQEFRTPALERLAFSPFYRLYFISKKNYGYQGFYCEGFLRAFTYEREAEDSSSGSVELPAESYFEGAAGFGLGWKWVDKHGFLIEFNAGLARRFLIADDPADWSLTGKIGLNFGWQL